MRKLLINIAFTSITSLLITANSLGQQAPDFVVMDTNGDLHYLYDDYLDQGKFVVLEFFNLELDPCLALAPLYDQLYQDWGGGDGIVQFLSLSDQDNNYYLEECWVDLYDLTFPVAGPEGWADDVFEQYESIGDNSFIGLPAYVLVHPDGSMDYDIREDNIEPLHLINSYLEEATGQTGIQVARSLPSPFWANGALNNIPSSAIIQIYDISGRLIHENRQAEGTVPFDHRSGIYLLRTGRSITKFVIP